MLVAVADVQHFGNETRMQERAVAKSNSPLTTVLFFFSIHLFCFFFSWSHINVCPIQVQDTFFDLTVPRGKDIKNTES